jgi:hypothetical protein
MRLAIAAVLTASLAAGAGRGADEYLKDGKLTAALEVRDVQGGFAGFTGQAFVIEPSGEFRVVRVFNEETKEVLRKGKLSEGQLAALAYHLGGQELAKLPKELGGFRGANPHVVSIRFGDKLSTLTATPGQDLREVTPGKGGADNALSRFVALVVIVEHWTKDGN